MFRAVIIDDEKIARRTLEKYLNDYAEGFEITASFSNGEGAIEYLKENDADVVFTDIKMPGMSGIEVAKWIYENKSHIKVVMVSGYSDFQYAQEAMKYKAVYYLLKVIDISEFKEVIGRLEKEIRKEKYASNYVDTETFFCNLLCGLFKTEENMYEEFARCCSVPKESAMCRIITVKFDESEQFLTEKWHYDKDMFRNVVSNIIKIAHKQCFTMLINQNEYEYRCTSENNNYTSIINGLFYRMLALFFGLMIILIIISVIVAVNNTSQFVTILDLFENRELYNSLNQNEISEIASKIICLMDDNEKLKNEVTSRNAQYEQWKTKALQTQITPHFLNNTLAVINYEVISNFSDSEKISGMISRLSRILSYTMITDKIFVTLGEELNFLRNYAGLLQLRYDNFNLITEADSELLKCRILRMSLQPLIENSVFYGYKEKGGDIYVRCTENDGNLRIVIRDDGIGMTKEKLAELMTELKSGEMTSSSVGIKNIYKRLEAVYGDKASLEIQSEPGKFTQIILNIPMDI